MWYKSPTFHRFQRTKIYEHVPTLDNISYWKQKLWPKTRVLGQCELCNIWCTVIISIDESNCTVCMVERLDQCCKGKVLSMLEFVVLATTALLPSPCSSVLMIDSSVYLSHRRASGNCQLVCWSKQLLLLNNNYLYSYKC